MKTGINLIPRKTKEELVKESRMYTLEIVAAVVIIIAEVASVFVVGMAKTAKKNEVFAQNVYNKDKKNLQSFSKTINTINNINQRYNDIHSITNTFNNPVTVLNRFEALVPGNISLSNFLYVYNGSITFNCSGANVLDVAHLIHNFSSNNKNNKYFVNTQIKSVQITYNGSNQVQSVKFNITTTYHNNNSTTGAT
ncbi:MAG: hypothetical protein ACYDBX_01530 [Patescibacteria group bacterium]